MNCAYPGMSKLVQTVGDMLWRLRTEAAPTKGELAKQTHKIHRTASVDADFHDSDLIIADARNVLNLGKPVAVMFRGVLGHVVDVDELQSIVARVMAAVPSGSYLALWDGTDTSAAVIEGGVKLVESGAIPYNLRSPEQVGQCFEGLEMVDPGLVPITQWRPDAFEVGTVEPFEEIGHYGAVARKP